MIQHRFCIGYTLVLVSSKKPYFWLKQSTLTGIVGLSMLNYWNQLEEPSKYSASVLQPTRFSD